MSRGERRERKRLKNKKVVEIEKEEKTDIRRKRTRE